MIASSPKEKKVRKAADDGPSVPSPGSDLSREHSAATSVADAQAESPVEEPEPAEVLPPPEPPVKDDAPPAPRQRARNVPTSSAPADTGKRGREHRYLQQLIKCRAEGMGYRVFIEKPLEAGQSVDVVLEKNEYSLACEISMTTSADHEVGNLEKCLATPFTEVVAVCEDTKELARLEALAKDALSPADAPRVRFLDTAGLFEYLQEREASLSSQETTCRGYRVNVNYKAVPNEERESRQGIVSKTVLKALRRKQLAK